MMYSPKCVFLEYKNILYIAIPIYHQNGTWYLPIFNSAYNEETLQISENFKILEEIEFEEEIIVIINKAKIKYPEYFI